MAAIIILDDSELEENVAFSPSDCSRRDGGVNAYNGTLTSCSARSIVSPSDAPHLQFEFSGPELVLRGRPDRELRMNYTLDDGKAQSAELVQRDFDLRRPDGALLWRLTDLPNTDHRISLHILAGELAIDYITYSPPDSPSPGRTFIVDDMDASGRVAKNDQWLENAVEDGRMERTALPIPFNRTMSRSRQGPGAVIEWDFTAIASNKVAIHGFVNHSPGIIRVRYEIDGGNAVEVTHLDGTQSVDIWKWDSVQFFERNVEPGYHKLKATVLELSHTQEYNVDFATFTTADPNSVPATGGNATTTTGSPDGTPTDTNGAPAGGSDGLEGEGTANRTAIIAGGVGGGLAALLVIVAGLLVYRWLREPQRRRRFNGSAGSISINPDSGAVSYITLGPNSSQGSRPRVGSGDEEKGRSL